MRSFLLASSLVVAVIALSVDKDLGGAQSKHLDAPAAPAAAAAPVQPSIGKIHVRYQGGHEKADDSDDKKKDEDSDKAETVTADGVATQKITNKGAAGVLTEGGSKPIAVIMLASILIGALVFAMSQTSRPHVANNTIMAADNVVAIFLAVLYFSAFSDVLEATTDPGHHIPLLFAHIAIVLFAAAFMAWKLRARSASIAGFCGAGAHFCGFMGGHFGHVLQEHHFTMSPAYCAAGTFALLLIVLLFLAGLYMLKTKVFNFTPGRESEDETVNTFLDRWDDVENDFSSMTLALYFVIVVRFAIVGDKYPEDGGDIDPGAEPDHGKGHRNLMLAWSMACLFGGGVLVHMLAPRLATATYVPKRAIGIFTGFVTQSWVFAFLLWGKMTFYEEPSWSVEPLFARIVFAGMCSIFAIVCVLLATSGDHVFGFRSLLVTSASFLVGIGWEETFEGALDALFDGMDNAHYLKAATAVGICFVVLPIQINFCKPLSMAAEEKEGA